MVSAESTAKKYAGQMAANYESKREKQERWHLENEAVHNMLLRHGRKHKAVLDVPVGTGRFLKLYKEFGYTCTGYDTSRSMLSLAKRKRQPAKLEVADIRKIPHPDRSFDISICVRFLDLVPENTMREALSELARVTKHHIILTIRLGDEYIAKTNTATHDARRFAALCSKLKFEPIEEAQIFQQGWRVMLLERVEHGRKTTRTLEHPE
jgi:ubiquinone/menaquinone biosynthesis C-methylase UbiE